MDRLVQQLDALLTAGAPSEEGTSGRGRLFSRRAPEFRRLRIVLSCAQCGNRNYRKTKARREGSSPLALSKFCNTCNAHTQHREAV